MKVVLTGATGFVGGETLAQLLEHPAVERVTCIGRRAPSPPHPKIVALTHEDFAHFEAGVIDAVRDHAACIWALGAKASDIPDLALLERVTHDYTLAFARALVACPGGAFRFCYLSGMGADPSETSRLKWERPTRHLKGRTERHLQELAANATNLSVYCFRPGGILPRGASPLYRVLAPIVVGVDALARALVRTATGARPPTATLGNAQIKRWARGAPAL
jgi:nucleoside-diphosphate-sugar epimerase